MADLYLVAERSADLLTPNDQYRRLAVTGNTLTMEALVKWAEETFAAAGQVVGSAEEAARLAAKGGWIVLKLLADDADAAADPHVTRTTKTVVVDGKNLCACCGQQKEMYYVPWCPRCEKPGTEGGCLNILQALRHLEAIGHSGIKDAVWDWLIDNAEVSNDTTSYARFPTDGQPVLTPEQMDDWDGDMELYWFQILTTAFNLPREGYRLHYSW